MATMPQEGLKSDEGEKNDMWKDLVPGLSKTLLISASKAFADQGFDKTTTRDVTASAGVSPAALYVHYCSKEELLFEISRIGHLSALNVVKTALDGDGEITTRVSAVARDFTLWHAHNFQTARVIHREWAALTPEHRKLIAGMRRETNRRVEEAIAEGSKSGFFETGDTKIAANAILSLGIDVSRWYPLENHYSPQRLGELYAGFVMNLLRCEQESDDTEGN